MSNGIYLNTFFNLSFFKVGESICADDFKNTRLIDTININLILSVTGLMMFKKPLSGESVKEYACITMVGGEKYFIDAMSHYDIMKEVNKRTINL